MLVYHKAARKGKVVGIVLQNLRITASTVATIESSNMVVQVA